jgi:AraC family transcriptional regulator
MQQVLVHDGLRERDPRSTAWGDVQTGQRVSISEGIWPGVHFLWKVENIARPTIWPIKQSSHAVIVHFGGAIRKIETELEGRPVSPAKPMDGDVWVVPAGHSYCTEATGGTVRYAVLNLDPASIGSMLPRNIEFGPVRPLVGHTDGFVHRCAIRLAELTQRTDDLSLLAARSLGNALLLHFFDVYPGKEARIRRAPARVRLNGQQRRMVREFIHDHLHRPILFSELTDLVRISSHDMLDAFRDAFDTTPAQYIIDARLARVRTLLRTSAKSIATIALETGFSSHAHLTNIFSRRYKMSPREFRSTLKL